MKEASCIIGIDAGTSVVKAVAFDCLGKRNRNIRTLPPRRVYLWQS